MQAVLKLSTVSHSRWAAVALAALLAGTGAPIGCTEQPSPAAAIEQPAAGAANAAKEKTAPPETRRPPAPDSLEVPEGTMYVPGGTTLIGNDYDPAARGASERHSSPASRLRSTT